ncbi:MAG: hypothetical protein R3254_02140 [Thiomicrorhabdus sp.]|nr:hypothetical protein [Thiomicrorhabdus sp.]
MSKRVKPNAEHRIVDGEVITDTIDEKIERGKAFSQEREQKMSSQDKTSLHEGDVNFIGEDIDPHAAISEGIDLQEESHDSPKSGSFFSKYFSYLLWLILFIAVILVLFLTRPNMDWQVQKINDLQSELAQIKQENVDLNLRLEEQNATIEQRINTQVNKAVEGLKLKTPADGQTDLAAVKTEFQKQIETLQQELLSLSESAGKQANQALSELNKMANQAPKTWPSTEEQISALKGLEEKLQAQMNTFGEKLTELFAFKSEQQILSKQPPVLKLDMPLDSLQIQQWIVEVNTQWILNGRPEETQQQLLALEQAVSLSDFKYTTQLARLIGQDLGYLKQLQDKQIGNPLPDTKALKAAVRGLTANNIQAGEDAASLNDADKSASQGFDALLERFSQMITVKKRADDSVTEVDGLLMNDVLSERLALLVNRLDWGLQIQSVQVVTQAVNDIKHFIKRHYAKEFAEFNLLLEPFEQIEFPSKKSLSIMQLDKAIEKQ